MHKTVAYYIHSSARRDLLLVGLLLGSMFLTLWLVGTGAVHAAEQAGPPKPPGIGMAPLASPTPVLVDVDAGPAVVAPGSTIVLTYTVDSPDAQMVSLGAGARVHGNFSYYSDQPHDTTVGVITGTNVVTRLFTIDTTPDVTLDLIWGLWSAGFGEEYGDIARDNVITVTSGPPTSTPTITPTPTDTPFGTPTNTPTATDTPTVTDTPPPTPALQAANVRPATAPPGSTIELFYDVWSPSAQQVELGAGIKVNGTGNWVYDPSHDRVVSLVAGNNTVSRFFNLGSAATGNYDVVWGVWDVGFHTEYGYQQQDNALTIAGPAPTPIPLCDYQVVAAAQATIVPGTTWLERGGQGETDHIDIPFPFTFYDSTYTVAHAGVGGNLQFPTATGLDNGCLPQASMGPAILAYFEPLAADLHDSDGEGLYTSVSGTAPNRILNIEWRAHYIGGPPNSVHFEIRLYEGPQSKFEIIYDQVDAGGSHAVVGVQRNGTDTHYQAYGDVCQTAPLTQGTKLTYTGWCPNGINWGVPQNSTGAALAAPGLYFDGSGSTQLFVGGLGGVKQAFSGNGGLLWNQSIGAAVVDRGPIIPIAGTNVAYFTSEDGYVNALDMNRDGLSFWPSGAGQIAGNGNLVAGVAYQAGANVGGTPTDLIFAGTFTNTGSVNHLFALNARNGAPVWAFPADTGTTPLGIIPTKPTVDWGRNTVYFGSKDAGGSGHGVWAVDTTSGALRWADTATSGVNLGGVVDSVPVLSDDGNTLYIGTIDSAGAAWLYALRTSDGSVRASFRVPDGVGGFHGTAWPEGTALYATAGDRLYAFTDDGLVTGTLPFNAGWTAPYHGGAGYATIPAAGMPLVLSGAPLAGVYLGGDQGIFYRLDPDTGVFSGQVDLNSSAVVSDPAYDFQHHDFYVTSGGYLFSIRDSGW